MQPCHPTRGDPLVRQEVNRLVCAGVRPRSPGGPRGFLVSVTAAALDTGGWAPGPATGGDTRDNAHWQRLPPPGCRRNPDTDGGRVPHRRTGRYEPASHHRHGRNDRSDRAARRHTPRPPGAHTGTIRPARPGAGAGPVRTHPAPHPGPARSRRAHRRHRPGYCPTRLPAWTRPRTRGTADRWGLQHRRRRRGARPARPIRERHPRPSATNPRPLHRSWSPHASTTSVTTGAPKKGSTEWNTTTAGSLGSNLTPP